jgi:transcriptional regulator GlxA family with amidase domain
MGEGMPGRDEELAVKVKRRLENLDGGVPQINELAEYFNVSRATLFRTFKSKYGMSVKEHLDRHRLEHAADLLAHTQIPLSGIAALCGYSTECYFNHAFAKKYSQPPGAFRLDTLSGSLSARDYLSKIASHEDCV